MLDIGGGYPGDRAGYEAHPGFNVVSVLSLVSDSAVEPKVSPGVSHESCPRIAPVIAEKLARLFPECEFPEAGGGFAEAEPPRHPALHVSMLRNASPTWPDSTATSQVLKPLQLMRIAEPGRFFAANSGHLLTPPAQTKFFGWSAHGSCIIMPSHSAIALLCSSSICSALTGGEGFAVALPLTGQSRLASLAP